MKPGLFISYLFCSLLAYGQSRSSLSRNMIRIGEQVELSFEFRYTDNRYKVGFKAFDDVIPCELRASDSTLNSSGNAELEIIKKFKDSLFKDGADFVWQGRYVVTSWDTGYLVILPALLHYMDSTYRFDPLMLHVSEPPAQAGKDLYDIREHFVDLGSESSSYVWWYIGGGVALGLLILLFLLKRKPKEKIPVLPPSLRDLTLLALQNLEASHSWQADPKNWYVELSFLLRSYLSSRYSLNLLEKTSHETALLLHQQGLANDTIQLIRLVLDYADMAKFAKAATSESEISRNVLRVRQIIHETSPIDLTLNVS